MTDTIVDYGVYISFGYHLKKLSGYQRCQQTSPRLQSFRRIGLKLSKIGAIQNRYPIVVYGVMGDREGKNPWSI